MRTTGRSVLVIAHRRARRAAPAAAAALRARPPARSRRPGARPAARWRGVRERSKPAPSAVGAVGRSSGALAPCYFSSRQPVVRMFASLLGAPAASMPGRLGGGPDDLAARQPAAGRGRAGCPRCARRTASSSWTAGRSRRRARTPSSRARAASTPPCCAGRRAGSRRRPTWRRACAAPRHPRVMVGVRGLALRVRAPATHVPAALRMRARARWYAVLRLHAHGGHPRSPAVPRLRSGGGAPPANPGAAAAHCQCHT